MSWLAAWLTAARPRTLTAAVVPVAVGTSAAARAGGADLRLALAALAAAMLIQVGTNLVNDWGDHRRGADGPDRLGPRRVSADGPVGPRAALVAGFLAFVGAAIVGGVLVARAGWPIVVIGAASIAAGIAYTAGPWPLAYHGLGEAFVLVFFGPVAVAGTELVQSGHVSATGLGASVPVGLLATAILVVNNVRDVDTDRRAAKRTLAVRLGRDAGRRLYATAVALAFATPAALVGAALASPATLVAWTAAPLAAAPLRTVFRHTDGPALNMALAATARLHLVFGMLLAAGLAWR